MSDSKTESVREAVANAGQLIRILEQEASAMSERSDEKVAELTVEKSQLLDRLARQQDELAPLLVSDEQSIDVQTLRQLLSECMQQNRHNQEIARIELDQSRKALNTLKSMLVVNEVSVYDASGSVAADSSKRHIGTA